MWQSEICGRTLFIFQGSILKMIKSVIHYELENQIGFLDICLKLILVILNVELDMGVKCIDAVQNGKMRARPYFWQSWKGRIRDQQLVNIVFFIRMDCVLAVG
eukprot:TRINITY_DN4996_c0_g1_i2.p4 TRINITY_DN4996_c0_g1~~TRINITY_DN4996_c0_g1_i2.p4  ORF type:complete len:103 (-),score=11.34 TRINITY_DN4996_c0_g1_i2:92-400(-)